jgi:hypothetical protein
MITIYVHIHILYEVWLAWSLFSGTICNCSHLDRNQGCGKYGARYWVVVQKCLHAFINAQEMLLYKNVYTLLLMHKKCCYIKMSTRFY